MSEAETRNDLDPAQLGAAASLPLLGLVQNRRAERAFLRLGIRTVAEFLATPRERLLELPGFGRRTYDSVRNQIERAVVGTWLPFRLLPRELLHFPVSALPLSGSVRQAVGALRFATVGDLLAGAPALREDPSVGEVGMAKVRQALAAVLRRGLDRVPVPETRAGETTFASLESLFSVLPLRDRGVLALVLGLRGDPVSVGSLAQTLRIPKEEAARRVRRIRRRVLRGAPAVVEQVRDEVERELRAFEGVLDIEHLAPGTFLHAVTREAGNPRLATRLVRFLFPRRFLQTGHLLTDLSPQEFLLLRTSLRELTLPYRLPIPLPELVARVTQTAPRVPHGLVTHLLEQRCGCTLQIDPRRGEIVHRKADAAADRLYEILREQRRPLLLVDLVFHYRDRHRRARKGRLLDHLRADPRFTEIGPDLWSLRERHLDEIEMLRGEAERIRDHLLAHGRAAVRTLLADPTLADRHYHLLLDQLKRCHELRYLGRGEFCPRHQTMSGLLAEMHKTLRRAMGEIPVSKFLDNQTTERRRAIAALLRMNRLFVQPARDRVDLLTNYPFNEERLRRLAEVVHVHLQKSGGYATLASVKTAIDLAGLGGEFLNEHLCTDLLRRQGEVDVLPGGIVALPSIALGTWITQRAREAIREAGVALTVSEILAQRPDLGLFAECLRDLLEADPALQTPDGLHYQVL